MDGLNTALSEELIKKLVAASVDAKQRSYSPYSKYRVGSALLTADGTIFTGRLTLRTYMNHWYDVLLFCQIASLRASRWVWHGRCQ